MTGRDARLRAVAGAAIACGLLAAPRVARLAPSAGLGAFLAASGIVTAAVRSPLLGQELPAGIARAPYAVRTTSALDLGLIAPLCLAAARGVGAGAGWAMRLVVPLPGLEALLLPLMAAQTAMQLRPDMTFGREAAAPFLGFGFLSGPTVLFLRRAPRAPHPEAPA